MKHETTEITFGFPAHRMYPVGSVALINRMPVKILASKDIWITVRKLVWWERILFEVKTFLKNISTLF